MAGVAIGPQDIDPDEASALLDVPGTRVNVKELIAINAAAHPEDLMAVAALADDDAATEALDWSEVAKTVGLDEDQIESARVKGKDTKYVYYLFSVESGRTQRGYFPLDSLGQKLSAPKVTEPKAPARKRPRKAPAKKK